MTEDDAEEIISTRREMLNTITNVCSLNGGVFPRKFLTDTFSFSQLNNLPYCNIAGSQGADERYNEGYRK